MSITPPLLFGVDPDETWDYIPKAAKKAGLSLPCVILKAPSLAATVQRDELISEWRKAALALEPTVLDEIAALTGGKFKIAPLKEDATEEEAREYVERVKEFSRLNLRWSEAHEKVSPQFREREEAINLRILSESITGWRGLQSASGKAIEFEKVAGRLGEVFRGDLRDELIEAAVAGTFVSEADAVGLQSSPASQAA